MYTVKRKEGNYEVTETYQSWYEVLFEGYLMGFWYMVAGIIIILATPFMAIRAIFKPNCTGHHGHYSGTVEVGEEEDK